VAVGVAQSTPRAKGMSRAALGVDLAKPTATLRRGLEGQAGLAGALGVSRHSCSGHTKTSLYLIL
jgi:hypothetical protein